MNHNKTPDPFSHIAHCATMLNIIFLSFISHIIFNKLFFLHFWPILNDVSVKGYMMYFPYATDSIQMHIVNFIVRSLSCNNMQTHCIHHNNLYAQFSIWMDNYCKLWPFVIAISISKSNLTFLFVQSVFSGLKLFSIRTVSLWLHVDEK